MTAPHIVTRLFNAPRELVWKANTEPDRMSKWFAPAGADAGVKQMELRVGGVCHYYQRAADGSNEVWGLMTFVEVDPLERLVYRQSFSDAEGNITAHPMAPTWPRKMNSKVTFEDLGNNTTRMTVEWTPFEASEEEVAMFESARAGMDQGWKGTLDKLEEYLEAAMRSSS